MWFDVGSINSLTTNYVTFWKSGRFSFCSEIPMEAANMKGPPWAYLAALLGEKDL